MAFTPRHEPFDHQRACLRESIAKRDWALFMEMGTGKSYVAINTLAFWFDRGHVDRAVYFAKAGEYANFYYDQVPEHWPADLKLEMLLYSSYEVHTARFRDGLRRLKSAPDDTFKLLVANVEGLSGKRLPAVMNDFVTRRRWALLVDESTAFKNHKSGRSKTLYGFAPRAKMRRLMTGTAVTESPLDLWGQVKILGPGYLDEDTFTAYRAQYCNMETSYGPGGQEFPVITGYKNHEKLAANIAKFSTQVLKRDCLDLPEKVYVRKLVDLDPEHRRVYDRLREEAMLEVGDGRELPIVSAMNLSSKMHQVACGQIRTDEGEYVWRHTAKLDVLESVLEEARGKVIVFAPYRAALLRIVERLTELYGRESLIRYFGGVPDDERAEGVRAFQGSDSGPRFMVANQQSAGFGLTLTRANTVVYFANSYRLELRLQSEDRIHRIGQRDDCLYVDIVARDTVDERVVQALRDKRKMSDLIMSRPPAEWL